MLANAKALLTAKEEVFIIDWWLSPELIRVDVGNAYGTTLKLPSDIAAENEPSAGTKTVQMVTTKMAEQAGEAPIKDTYVDISESTGI
ncbi:unnamed protein product [Rotaria sp. Silwood1]|nr:unnamed protein product [Rotaria sp. Silwood1]